MSIGHAASLVCMVLLLGLGVEPSPPDLEPLRAAAMRGDADAQYRLALAIRKDKDTPEDRQQAAAWLTKAASQGHGQAQFVLGHAYRDGLGVDRDYRRAVTWLGKAADQKHAAAWLMLGQCHAEGGLGIIQDLPQALACFDRAAALDDAQVWHDLGWVYRQGRGAIEWDWRKSHDYYLRAAKQGHPEAQYAPAQYFEAGIGVDASLPKALEWMTKAAEAGEPWAAWDLGERYENGDGVPKDPARAKAWYDKAANHVLFKAFRDFKYKMPAEPAKEEPAAKRTTDDVIINVRPDKDEFEVDEPMLIHVVWRNVGKLPYSWTASHSGGLRRHFWVTDAKGRELPFPFQQPMRRVLSVGGLSSRPVLMPGEEKAFKYLLNQSAHIDQPGSYSIDTWGSVVRGEKGEGDWLSVKVVPAKITVKAADPKRRREDILELMRAYANDRGVPERFPADDQRYGGKLDLVRYLAFYREPQLINFFLDVIEHEDVNGFAAKALRAIPDRAAVLRCYQERLDHPERFDSLKHLHSYLSLTRSYEKEELFSVEGLAVWKAEQEITRKYQKKALEVVKTDRQYRYAHLVPGLIGGADDLFLMDYLLRCQPAPEVLYACSSTLQRVNLSRGLIPDLVELLQSKRTSTAVKDAAIFQSVRLDRARFLPELGNDPERLSPEMRRLLQTD